MDIIHSLEIDTTPEKLFTALSSDGGIAAWWTQAKTEARVGAINTFSFGASAVTFRIEKLDRSAIVWSAEQVPPEWNGTRVRFEIRDSEKPGRVALLFTHEGFGSMTPVVTFTSYAWANYLRSLKLFLETGRGEPFGSSSSIAAGTTPRTKAQSMPRVVMGNHSSVIVPREDRENIRKFYCDVLGGTITKAQDERDFIRLGDGFYIVFMYGDVPDASEFLRSARALWLELKSDDVEGMRQRIVDSGLVRKLELPDPHLYFQAPGGQCLRLVGIDEDLSFYEGAAEGPNVANVKAAVKEL
ncbi:MAG TPA: SRPBCC domain-containing protein [Polyangiaceae bacterium]|nr:SRPBCC domain-containing protein [Polyangiaceae bacterium]